MNKIKPRIPECEAIINSDEFTMQEYSDLMINMLSKQYDQFAHHVIKKVAPVKNAKVLEIGPGPGWGGISLVKQRPDLILDGIEASFDMIEIATQNAKKSNLEGKIFYFKGNGEEMSMIPDNKYDLVISRESLHHWNEPEKVFVEIARVLKPNGKVCIYDHRRDLNLFGKTIVFLFSAIKAGKMSKHWKASIASSYTSVELSNMLNSIGLNQWSIDAELMDLVIYKS